MAKKKRKTNFVVVIMTFFSIFFLCALIFNSGNYFYTKYKLEKEMEKKEAEYLELQEESEYLKNEIVKLQDPEYLARYARENYSYSKDGELVIKINNDSVVDEEEAAAISTNDYKNYAYIAIGFVTVIMFVYLISKKREKVKE